MAAARRFGETVVAGGINFRDRRHRCCGRSDGVISPSPAIFASLLRGTMAGWPDGEQGLAGFVKSIGHLQIKYRSAAEIMMRRTKNGARLSPRFRGDIAFEPLLLLGDRQKSVAHAHQALVFIAAGQRILGAGFTLRRPAAQFGGGQIGIHRV